MSTTVNPSVLSVGRSWVMITWYLKRNLETNPFYEKIKQTGFEVEAAKTLFLFCFVFSLLFFFFWLVLKLKEARYMLVAPDTVGQLSKACFTV